MCTQADNEDDGWQITMNYHSLWVSYIFVVLFMYTPCSKLTNCFISKAPLLCIFSCCVILHKLRGACKNLIPVRVLLIIGPAESTVPWVYCYLYTNDAKLILCSYNAYLA